MLNVSKEEFGEFIKFMRKSINWSAGKIGEELGTCASTVLRWEKGYEVKQFDPYEIEQKIREVVKNELRMRREAV